MVKTNEVAFTNEAPWRGLGVKVSPKASVAEMMSAAKIDFTIARNPIHREDGSKIEGFFELAKKEQPDHTFDIVGSRYKPTQPRDAMEFFDDLVRKGGARMELMGGLMDHRIVWGLAALDEFTLPAGDKIKAYLFLASPAIQGKSLIARMTTLRNVCNNTLSIALRQGRSGFGDTFRMNHRNEFNEIRREEARRVLGVAHDQAAEFAKVATQLSKKKLARDKAEEIITSVFGKEEKVSPRVTAIMSAYDNAPGAQPGSAWGALNAVTYWTDHMSGKSADRRLTNAWVGRNANKKVEVMRALLAA